MAIKLIADRLLLAEMALDVASLPRGDDVTVVHSKKREIVSRDP
jgi:hypothetical protein